MLFLLFIFTNLYKTTKHHLCTAFSKCSPKYDLYWTHPGLYKACRCRCLHRDTTATNMDELLVIVFLTV